MSKGVNMLELSYFPSFEEINFTDPPRLVNNTSYDDVRTHIINHFSKTDDVLSIYEFGTVNAPSISDIDLMLVLRDSLSSNIHDVIKRDAVSDLAQYLMMDNTLMLVNKEGFKSIPKWDDINLVLLYGEDISQDVVSKEDFLCTEVARVMDWLPERTMRMMELITRKEVPSRASLCLVHSFIYVLERLEKTFNIKLEGSDEYISSFHDLRSDWFSVKDGNEQLYTYLKQGIMYGFEAIKKFDEYCVQENLYSYVTNPKSGTFRLNPKITSWTKQKMYYHFTCDINNVSAEESFRRSEESNSSVIVIPMTYYQHIVFYGLNNKGISSKILESVEPFYESATKNIDPVLKRVLSIRIEIIDKMGSFLRKNSIDRGLLKFGWFL